jgi:hypothetical protein
VTSGHPERAFTGWLQLLFALEEAIAKLRGEDTGGT